MIYTLTLNPAVDLELTVEAFRFDAVDRALASRMDCGGKGFNVSRMLAILETASTALGFVGGKSGERLEQTLRSLGIATDFNWIDGETRTNVSIVRANHGQYLKVNEAGPTIGQAEVEALIDKVSGLSRSGDWWVLSGSLPPGVPATIYANLIEVIETAGAHVFLDTSGEPLHAGCAARPTLLKPNLEEARELTAATCAADADSAQVARALLALGPRQLVISMGREGALLVAGDDVQLVPTPKIEERNPIGAGDSMVGGIVCGLSRGDILADAVRLGVACGAATASRSGTELGSMQQVEALLALIGDSIPVQK
ncbi:MAG: 1-phosphofructokinase [Gammaproteobacteria bacterium]|nr:1-phosphofructokinase [Gammaproteobacteria bacterium]